MRAHLCLPPQIVATPKSHMPDSSWSPAPCAPQHHLHLHVLAWVWVLIPAAARSGAEASLVEVPARRRWISDLDKSCAEAGRVPMMHRREGLGLVAKQEHLAVAPCHREQRLLSLAKQELAELRLPQDLLRDKRYHRRPAIVRQSLSSDDHVTEAEQRPLHVIEHVCQGGRGKPWRARRQRLLRCPR